MNKEFTLEEVLKAAEMHTNGTCGDTCPLESMEIDCENTFAETVLELNKKNENLSAENKQLQLAIERKDKRFEEINNELILEKAKSEKLENGGKMLSERVVTSEHKALQFEKENENLNDLYNEAMKTIEKMQRSGNERVKKLEDVIVNFKRTFADFFNALTNEQQSIWRIGMEFASTNALADEIENKRKEGVCNE